MTSEELKNILEQIQKIRAESQTLEIKSAEKGCPPRLYDTLSSFSNQDSGGILLFGVDEAHNFAEVGVYDAQDLMKHVTEQCNQMEPVVRPIFTTLMQCDKVFVSAEIPGIDITERPCFYRGKGRLTGSYIRVGDADEPMTEYEIYSYEAFRRKYQDDVRPVERASIQSLDSKLLNNYLHHLKDTHPNLQNIADTQICDLMSLTKNGHPTLTAVMLFSMYPQAYFPQFCITAVAVPGTEIGQLGQDKERFLDNQRIEGTLPQMLNDALSFVRKNTRVKTVIDTFTGIRNDKTDYPMAAVREAVLNALIHRDYSIHTEGMPIQLLLFEDRLEIKSPGGLYGRIRIDQLGKVQLDTRNPVLAVAMEELDETENRYSGIPTIQRELAQAHMPAPEFLNERGSFIVRFRKQPSSISLHASMQKTDALVAFCAIPRSRQEIANFLRVRSVSYVIKRYVQPLIIDGQLRMTDPAHPQSKNQKFVAGNAADT